MTAEEKLRELNIDLPPPPKAAANYVTFARSGELVMTSGQLPWQDGEMRYTGRLGDDVSLEDGYASARRCAINAIAQLKHGLGDLEKIVQVVRIEGHVHAAPGFYDHPQVLNGASDLFMEVFGERGRHTRSALGTVAMPLNAATQISVWASISD